MKLFLYISFLFGITTNSYAQKKCGVSQAYAYQRATLPGTITTVIDETGTVKERPRKPKITYFIYLETKPSELIQPSLIWINGKAYKLKTEKITTPVLVPRIDAVKSVDTLVKETSNNVIRIQPVEEASVRPSNAVAKKIKNSQIVIEYVRKSKKQYYTIDRIKTLTPLAMQ